MVIKTENPKLKVGDRVLIFGDDHYSSDSYYYQKGINEYKEGAVESYEMSHDLTGHGSGYYVWVYMVMGDDGKKYRGSYIEPTVGNAYFYTKKDYIKYLRSLERYELSRQKDIIKETNRNRSFIVRAIEKLNGKAPQRTLKGDK